MFNEYILYISSIGLSDMIEFWLNPIVHKIHNAPDIMKKSFDNYNSLDAFTSGIICSWIVIIPIILFYLLGIKPKYLILLSIINLLIPIFSYLTNVQNADIFFSHKMLYLIGSFYFSFTLFYFIIKKLIF
jgi:hypothetical protein